MSFVTIEDPKAALRREAAMRRDALPAPARQAAAEAIATRPFPLTVAAGMIVSGFTPMKSEISPMSILLKLADAGANLALPVIAGRGQPLTMRSWRFGEPLNAGVWGIREPKPEAPEADPDILLVPLLAFDRSGHRLGYGGGYYDRTIRRLRRQKAVKALGIGFAAQEVSSVPATPCDKRLDLLLTENEVIEYGVRAVCR